MNSVEKYIFENYRALVENAGFSVYYVEFQKNHKDSILRLYIEPKDADQTMDIDAYILEVSSPGIERTLFVPEHFERYVGEKVRLGLYKSLNKKKEFIAILKSADENGIEIDDGGDIIALEYKDISKAQLYCDF